MTPPIFIRRRVFRCETQHAFAAMLGVRQPTVSRWERAGRIPSQAFDTISGAARKHGIEWSQSWLVEVPAKFRNRRTRSPPPFAAVDSPPPE